MEKQEKLKVNSDDSYNEPLRICVADQNQLACKPTLNIASAGHIYILKAYIHIILIVYVASMHVLRPYGAG